MTNPFQGSVFRVKYFTLTLFADAALIFAWRVGAYQNLLFQQISETNEMIAASDPTDRHLNNEPPMTTATLPPLPATILKPFR